MYSVGTASNALWTNVWSLAVARAFPPSPLPVLTLLHCDDQPPCTITLHHNKNPRVGSHTIVWTHRNAAHTRSTLKDGMWLPKRQRNWKQPHTYLVLPGYKEEYLYTYIYTHTYTLVYITLIQSWKWWLVFNRKKWKSLSGIVRLRESS